MKRQPECEHLNRLTVKPLDQVFIMRAKEGLGCSEFEAEALTELVKEVYFPWLSQPEAIQAGQWGVAAVARASAPRLLGREERRSFGQARVVVSVSSVIQAGQCLLNDWRIRCGRVQLRSPL